MATKLKNLSVTSVDLVDRGANPDAHIRLFKRGEQPQETDPDMGLFQKFLRWLKKGFEDATGTDGQEENPVDDVEKEAQTFGASLNREQMRHVTSEMFDNCYALSDSFCSILCDDTLDEEKKKALMLQSLDEFAETVKGAVGAWAAGKQMDTPQSEAGIQKSTAQQEALAKLLGQYNLGDDPTQPQSGKIEKEVVDTMKIDKSKMTPEELAALADLEKRYGIPDGDGQGAAAGGAEPAAPEGGVEKGAQPPVTPAPVAQGGGSELHPEVAKALADFQELTKRQNEELEAMRKSLEVERLTSVAKKYEPLGKNAPELAAKLYDLKKAGGTFYDDYIALLDESLTTLNKSGLFGEIGSNRQGSAGTTQTIGIKAQELQKAAADGLSSPDAIIKAFEENPELAAQYEAEYMGR